MGMKIDFRALANSNIRNLMPYQPGKPIEELQRELEVSTTPIKLASNENPLGPSKLAIEAVEKQLINAHFYPDANCFELKQTLAKKFGINANQLTIGNGSENILELIVRSYLYEGDNAVLSQYAFAVIPVLLNAYLVHAKIALARNFAHHIDKMIRVVDDKTRVLFLVNPNNPTGTYTSENEFIELMESVPQHVLVVVDEAYKEFMLNADYPDTVNYLSRYPNLVITRSFSKIYGLAGFRIGYAISSPEIADILNRARAVFCVNSFAAIAANAAISDKAHIDKTLELNEQGKKQIMAGLETLKLKYIPSVGNFISINVGSGVQVYEKLCREGIVIRPLAPYGLSQFIRVTIGTQEQNQRFLNALDKLIQTKQIVLQDAQKEEEVFA